MAPTNAPNVTKDPTHAPWERVSPKLFSNAGIAEDVHENTIPRQTAERVSVKSVRFMSKIAILSKVAVCGFFPGLDHSNNRFIHHLKDLIRQEIGQKEN